MSNVVSLVLQLKDMVSGGIQKVAATTRASMGSVVTATTRMGAAITATGGAAIGALGTVTSNMNNVTQAANNASGAVNNLNNNLRNSGNAGGGGGGISLGKLARGSFYGNLAARGVEMAARKTYELGNEALGAGMDAEQQIIALKTFIGKDRAKSLYAELQKDSALTPFTTAQILPVMQQLIASGKTPEKAKKDTWSLMNALSATGNAGSEFMLGLTGSHLSQMAAVGKVDAYFMKEFERTAHIPMTKLLGDYMNVPMKQVAAWKEDGTLKDHVTYDMFVGALEKAAKAGGMFAGALEDQSQTIKGKMSTIKDWWNVGMAKAVLDPTTHDNITKLEDRIIQGLVQFPELIGRMSPVVNELFDNFNELVPSLKDYGESVMSMLRPVGAALMSNNVLNLSKSLLSMGAEIGNELVPAIQLTAQALVGLAGVVNPLINSVTNWRQNFINFLVETSSSIMDMLHPERKLKAQQSANVNNAQQGHTIVLKEGQTLDEYYRQNPGVMPQPILGVINMPGKKGSAAATGKMGTDAGLEDSSDAIVGGGRKQIIINVNAPMYKVEHQVFQTIKDAIKDFEPQVRTALVRILDSANMAM
jgi:hypothetical protein